MGAYDRHLERLRADTAYSDGVHYGRTGGTVDANPWSMGDQRRSAWNDGWRVGTVIRSFDESLFDMERELAAPRRDG